MAFKKFQVTIEGAEVEGLDSEQKKSLRATISANNADGAKTKAEKKYGGKAIEAVAK